jgi:hypothetical protein
MERAMQQTVLWLQTWTVLIVLLVLAIAFTVGVVLRSLVKRSTMDPSHALSVIRSVAVIVGGGIGSVVVLLLLIILWPQAGNWVINTFLSDTLIWQTEFQQWITQKINDPMTSSAIGLLIQRVQFGSAFLGFFLHLDDAAPFEAPEDVLYGPTGQPQGFSEALFGCVAPTRHCTARA